MFWRKGKQIKMEMKEQVLLLYFIKGGQESITDKVTPEHKRRR